MPRYRRLVRSAGQGIDEIVPAQNIARITRTMTDANNACFNSLVICVRSFARLGCQFALT